MGPGWAFPQFWSRGVLASHAVADGGNDTVTENDDVAFVDQVACSSSRTVIAVIARVDSMEEPKPESRRKS